MEMRSLGATGERVSALCMGCWEIGGQAWGDFPAWDGVRLVQQAFDAGITTFDTAEVYGNGRSEVLLGEALYGRRDDAFIISKVGYLPGTDGAQSIQGAKQPRDYSPKRIRDACDLALRRLRTEYIDAYLLHDPPLHIVRHEAPFAVLEELQAAGKIRWWGISARTGQPETAVEAIRRWGAPVVETPYNAVDDGAGDELLPLAAEHGTGVFARSPFANGLILLSEKELAALPASDWRQSEMFRERLADAAGPRERIQDIADLRDELPYETAMRFVLGHQAASTCIVGLSNAEDIAANTPVGDPPYLSAEEIAVIRGQMAG